jgi:hypothetical protein
MVAAINSSDASSLASTGGQYDDDEDSDIGSRRKFISEEN